MPRPRTRRPKPVDKYADFWPTDDALIEAELLQRLSYIDWYGRADIARKENPDLQDRADASRWMIEQGHTPPPEMAADCYPAGYPIPQRVDYISQMSPACRAAATGGRDDR
jgi:hypothetical protein